MNITFGDIPVQYLNGIDLSMLLRICEVICCKMVISLLALCASIIL